MANIITDNLIQSKPAMDSIERFCDRYVTFTDKNTDKRNERKNYENEA